MIRSQQMLQFRSFCFACKNRRICSVLCISRQKHYWYLQHFLHFCIVPTRDVKTKKCCNLQHFVVFEKQKKTSEKCVKTAFFSDFGYYPQNGGGGGMLLETLMSDPNSVQKATPQQPEGFLLFCGARRRRVGGLARASP